MKILIVEDDITIARPLIEDLQHQHLVVNHAVNGEQAWEMHRSEEYDLILLDWMLPKLSGIELCTRLRESGYSGSILMLTARGDKHERILGLDSGADDYIVKPCDIDELGARVRALLRRGRSLTFIWQCGALSVDTRACKVTYEGNIVDVTPTEYRLLMNFLRNPERTFSKHDLIDRLWSFDDAPSEAVIKTHIMSLRQKLTAAGCNANLISTVYGFGYKLNAEFR
ncbi:N/A [soil metagenome]